MHCREDGRREIWTISWGVMDLEGFRGTFSAKRNRNVWLRWNWISLWTRLLWYDGNWFWRESEWTLAQCCWYFWCRSGLDFSVTLYIGSIVCSIDWLIGELGILLVNRLIDRLIDRNFADFLLCTSIFDLFLRHKFIVLNRELKLKCNFFRRFGVKALEKNIPVLFFFI